MTARFPDDGALREAFQGPEAEHTPGSDCIPPDQIWNAVRRELPSDEVGRILDHVAGCPSCTEGWMLARSFLASAEAAAPGRSPRPSTRWVLLSAAAAVAVVAIGLGVLGIRERPGAPARTRAVEEPSIQSLVAESKPLPRARCVLRWTPAADGARYQVRVATERLVPLASEGGLDRPEYTVPEEALAGLPAGASIVWQVHVSLPDGRTTVSETFVNRVE